MIATHSIVDAARQAYTTDWAKGTDKDVNDESLLLGVTQDTDYIVSDPVLDA